MFGFAELAGYEDTADGPACLRQDLLDESHGKVAVRRGNDRRSCRPGRVIHCPYSWIGLQHQSFRSQFRGHQVARPVVRVLPQLTVDVVQADFGMTFNLAHPFARASFGGDSPASESRQALLTGHQLEHVSRLSDTAHQQRVEDVERYDIVLEYQVP